MQSLYGLQSDQQVAAAGIDMHLIPIHVFALGVQKYMYKRAIAKKVGPTFPII